MHHQNYVTKKKMLDEDEYINNSSRVNFITKYDLQPKSKILVAENVLPKITFAIVKVYPNNNSIQRPRLYIYYATQERKAKSYHENKIVY